MTIKDIARESGYAVSTVSRALNNHPDVSTQTKEKINAIVAAHQFVPNSNARQLKQQNSKSIAIIVKGSLNAFFAGIIEQMENWIAQTEYGVQVHYVEEDADELLAAEHLCRELKPLGILFLGGNIATFQKRFSAIELPCVIATTTSPELRFENLSCVGIDDKAAGKRAMDFLLHKGHQKIGILGGKRENSYISQLRFEGCLDAVAEAGGAFDESYYQTCNFNYGSAYRGAKKLLERKRDITAVFAMSDVMAVGAMRAIFEAGYRCPEDISVVGFDGIELGKYMVPSLTTVRQPGEEIAKQSVALLLSHIERHTPAKTVLLEDALIEGESVLAINR
ncbi:MAG: LacI family DNA-binding transcriptional regulator [Oscillospiraceae bacterium]|jgi:LacI family transcriptional regulator|nr:LacI family DNA-binding transcriptional regulator [Oscillospiraceae bacterium]